MFDAASPTVGLWVVLLGFTVASATQDVAIDAYTIALLDPGEEGDANGVRVSAYRVALIASGGGCSVLAPWLGWPVVFVAGAALSSCCSRWRPRRRRAVAVAAAAERRHWLAPMRRWLLRPGAWAVFLFVLIYKLGDAAMAPMVKPFWLDRGLAVAEIGIVSTSSAWWRRSPARWSAGG